MVPNLWVATASESVFRGITLANIPQIPVTITYADLIAMDESTQLTSHNQVSRMLFRAGYLTIRDYNRATKLLTLDHVNEETKQVLVDNMISRFFAERSNTVDDVRALLHESDYFAFLHKVNEEFLGVVERVSRTMYNDERCYQHLVYQYVKWALGDDCTWMEDSGAQGYSDLCISCRHFVVIEFKKVRKDYAKEVWTDRRRSDVEKARRMKQTYEEEVAAAFDQIRTKNYDATARRHGCETKQMVAMAVVADAYKPHLAYASMYVAGEEQKVMWLVRGVDDPSR